MEQNLNNQNNSNEMETKKGLLSKVVDKFNSQPTVVKVVEGVAAAGVVIGGTCFGLKKFGIIKPVVEVIEPAVELATEAVETVTEVL